ncbi:PucR family transcriptional regulator [Paenibacillus piri]|uniref:PucR family transcriptional regulator n=1 Tax=Paenibacillus piri TaxID=2547395 RepID=A0A4R5KLY0_9BACL|nr:PucR family transcriptional regulator [Paenibacillus piri]TDF95925.1 PucR family transcriptional regulator [Paenibacillus piri]
MNLTVREALDIFPLSEGRLVAGVGGLTRVIKSLNLMDAPDFWEWIKPGEMLLSTAFVVKDSPNDFLKLLQKLNERGSAALGIKLGRYWTQIPRIVLEEADRLQFPLIELPFEFAFSDQINALFKEQFVRNTKNLHNVLDMQKKLMHFAMQTGDQTNYFQVISDILAHPIVVVGIRGEILYNTSDWTAAGLLQDWPWPPNSKQVRAQHGGDWVYRIPLIKNGECYGFLLVLLKDALEPQEEGPFHQAAVMLSYHLETFQEQQPSVANYRLGTAIERYLLRQTSTADVLEEAQAIGDQIWTGSYLCVLTTFKPEIKNSPHIHKKLSEIRREIKFDPGLSSTESHHLFVNNDLFSLFTFPDKEKKSGTFVELVARGYSKMLSTINEHAARCFVSKTKYSIEELLNGYEECLEAKRISERLSFDSSVILFSDLEFTYLLRHIPREVMKRYCEYILHNLMQKDEEYSGELLRTLEVYFANKGQINDTAKQLFIHRNTVLYRLEKISSLLNIDLRKTDDLLQIKLVLMFQRLMRMEHHGSDQQLGDHFASEMF